jgi:hypothetical protein
MENGPGEGALYLEKPRFPGTDSKNLALPAMENFLEAVS